MANSATYRLVFFAVLLILTLGFLSPAALAQKKIGVSLPLSGENTRFGQQFLVGAELALKIRNQISADQFDLVIVDDACDEEIGKIAAEDLRAAEVSMVTGLLCNSAAKSVADELADSGIPILVGGARSERLIKDREREGWNLWRLSPGDTDAAFLAGQIFAKAWQGQAYGIVDDGTVYGRNLADAFRAVMEDAGLPPQFTDNYRPTQSTQARMVRRLKRAGITHVFIGGSAEDVAMIARNAKELEIPLEIVGGETLSIMPYLPKDQIPPDGLKAIVEKSSVDLSLSPGMINLLEKEKIEPELHVLAGYQSIEIAFEAVRETHEATRKALESEQFDTLLGPVSFDRDGRNTAQQYGLYQWIDGTFQQVTQ